MPDPDARTASPTRTDPTTRTDSRTRTDSNAARQPVLDAVVALQGHRLAVARSLEPSGREVPGARIVARGHDVPGELMRRATTWRHLLSTRPRTTAPELRESLAVNRRCLADGLVMQSVFDREGTTAAAKRMLANEDCGAYHLSYAPVQMRLADHREVFLQGPDLGTDYTVMCVTVPAVLDAAYRYWNAVWELAEPCAPAPSDRELPLSPRQRQVMELLGQGLSDARVAQQLGVSVRTVRYEVAAVMELLGARSRFEAGLRYAERNP